MEIISKALEEENTKILTIGSQGPEKDTDPFFITTLWYFSFFTLLIADILEVILNIITLFTAGLVFVIPYITLLFELPGAFSFFLIIHYYIKTKQLNKLEGYFYLILVFYELAVTFAPFLQLSDSLPLKTTSSGLSRWRIIRLKKAREKIKQEKTKQKEIKQQEEQEEEKEEEKE